MDIVITPSWLANKKYAALIRHGNNLFTVHFGAAGYEDFTTHKDIYRKRRYIARHKGNEDWNNIYTAGFWSRWLLWNRPTLAESIEDVSNQIGIPIFYLKL